MITWHDLREQMLRLAALFRRERIEHEIAEELEFHLAMKQRKHAEDRGMNAAEAANAAKRDLGSMEKWKEVCRDVGRMRAIEDFARDLALAARMLRKSPAFTAVALITLTLAIGANTAIFSLINALLLRPLPLPQADRLAILRIQPDDFGYAFNYTLFKYLEKHSSGAFSHVFAFTGETLQIHGSNGTERVSGQLVSGQYFSALRVNAQLGRYIGPDDDRPGLPGGQVAVISDRFWRNWFGADPHVLGRGIVLSNAVFTVVGVMPKDFRGADAQATPDVFLPFEAEPLVDAPINNIAAGNREWWFQVGARLDDGVTLEQANAFLRAAAHAMFEATFPNPTFTFDGHNRSQLYLTAEPGATGYSYLRMRFRKPLSVLMALVVLVLLIACLNLATLLMARAASREREIATRFALGASRARLLRQLLTESMLLAAAGTALGLALSPILANLLNTFLSDPRDPTGTQLNIAPDVRVFTFTAAVAAIATILTGMAPALRSTGRDLQQRMRQIGTALRGSNNRRFWPRALLACEVALALVLVTGAGLLGYSLFRLHEIPTGFEPRGLAALYLDMEKQPRDGEALVNAYREIANGLATLPGVTAVSFVNMLPLSGWWIWGDTHVPGQPNHQVYRNQVGPDYFRAMRTPLLAGREFQWTDTDARGRIVILNEAAARVLFPKQNPIGQHVEFDDKTEEVVGVVADSKYTTLRDIAPPTAYTPITQGVKNKPSHAIVMRIEGPPAPAIFAARDIVKRVVPEIPPPVAITMEQTIAESLASERMMATLALFFAAAALLITGIGLYGTLAYATERRTAEIGIRFALGAQQADVMSMVCRENLSIALGGCFAGIAASIAASRVIASFLYSTTPRNPVILGVAALLLVSIAAAASLIPAIRASRIDPMAAIRYE
ncbi:MAG: ABC transporter permease [Bryobacteraceae bacterium]